jgi:rubrerythrin
LKHEKTCNELKTLKHDHENLEKELNNSKVVIKTLKKEAKESDAQHTKILKVKEDTIEKLKEFKAHKISEEKELKQMEKKVNKKLKSVEERESKLNLKMKHYRVDLDNNIDHSCTNCSSILSLSKSSPAVSSVMKHSSYNISKITTYTSMLTHWLPLPKKAAADYPSFTAHKINFAFASDKPNIPQNMLKTFKHRASKLKVWKCDQCEQTFHKGYTMDQALHKAEHLKKT